MHACAHPCLCAQDYAKFTDSVSSKSPSMSSVLEQAADAAMQLYQAWQAGRLASNTAPQSYVHRIEGLGVGVMLVITPVVLKVRLQHSSSHSLLSCIHVAPLLVPHPQ